MTTDAGDYGIASDKWPGLAKVTEEAGELLKVLGKIMGSDGQELYWDGTDLRAEAHEEAADLLAALTFFIDKNLDWDQIRSRQFHKLGKFLEWHQA